MTGLVDNAPGLSKKVLTATLRKLEADGVVERHVYAEMPVRVEYALTALGWRLTELLMAAYEWAVAHEAISGNRVLADGTGASALARCRPVTPRLRDSPSPTSNK